MKAGASASQSMMSRELQRLQVPRQKPPHDRERASVCVRQLRTDPREWIVRFVSVRVKFLEEAGSKSGLTRLSRAQRIPVFSPFPTT